MYFCTMFDLSCGSRILPGGRGQLWRLKVADMVKSPFVAGKKYTMLTTPMLLLPHLFVIYIFLFRSAKYSTEIFDRNILHKYWGKKLHYDVSVCNVIIYNNTKYSVEIFGASEVSDVSMNVVRCIVHQQAVIELVNSISIMAPASRHAS